MAFATGAMGSLLAKLGELLKDEYKLQKGVRKDVEYLKRELASMHAALGKVGEVPPEQLDEQVKVWARELRELSYDMEDIVDTFMVRVDQDSSKGLIKKVVKLFKKGKTRHQIANEIQDIKARVQEVADRRNRNKVDDVPAIPAAATTVDPRLSAMYRKETDLVGIDEARDELIKRLTERDDASKQQLKIVSVVGFGGMGKTTIANQVYQKLKMQFDCWAFVSISRSPDMKKVLRDILLDVDEEKCGNTSFALWDERRLINELQKSLEHKRFNCMPTRKLTGQWRSRCLGSTLAVMKKSSKFLPVIGWSMWFAEYLFLERSWTKDEKTLKVTLFWACLLLYGAIELFKWTRLLSTWKGVGFTVAGLALVTGVMHVFIMFSQSERSSSARAAWNRVKKD